MSNQCQFNFMITCSRENNECCKSCMLNYDKINEDKNKIIRVLGKFSDLKKV